MARTSCSRRNRRATGLGLQRLAELPNPRGVDQRPDLPHRVIGGHILLQIDVGAHRRLRIGGAQQSGGPPDGRFSYHNCGERRRGFVNTLLGACILIAAMIGTDRAGLPLLIQNRFRLYRGE